MKIMIESYLTEQKLKDSLQQIFGNDWLGKQVRLPNSRRRFDMAFRSNDRIVLVEYDGDEHYRNSLKIKADREKDLLALKNSMDLVRIPYWLQLDAKMATHWFGVQVQIEQSFPHGFITTKLFPASFCELGIDRFIRELNSIPDDVRLQVVASIRERVNEYGIEYVLPEKLRELAM
jgi:hypothetical protein